MKKLYCIPYKLAKYESSDTSDVCMVSKYERNGYFYHTVKLSGHETFYQAKLVGCTVCAVCSDGISISS